MTSQDNLSINFPGNDQYLYGEPGIEATYRSCPEDFQVFEIPSFEPEGEGEHHFLKIRKTGENTDWVARQLANFCQIPVKEVGYAGKKDRHAITEQWFSVKLPLKRCITWSLFETDTIKVLESKRHLRKLRLGALEGNRFQLRLRDVSDDAAFADRVELIRSGVPNYFGEQRFGRESGNLHKGIALIRGEYKERQRHKKGLYISAVRSWLFNFLLSERIKSGQWNRVLCGDVMMLAGSKSHFLVEAVDEKLIERLDQNDVHLSGPLWGRGRPLVTDEALNWETTTLSLYSEICEQLENLGLNQERRALRLLPENLEAVREKEGQWLISFSLPSGAFATSVLRELCKVRTG